MTWQEALSTPVVIAALITAVLSGGVLPKIGAAAWRALTGRATRQRAEVDRVRTELASRDAAIEHKDDRIRQLENQYDDELTHRRILQEALSQTRRVIIDAPCLSAADLPPYNVPSRRKS